MNFTAAEIDFIKELRGAAGGRISPSTLQFLMKRRFNKTFSRADIQDFLAGSTPKPPVPKAPVSKPRPPLSTIRKQAEALIKEVEAATRDIRQKVLNYENTPNGITPILCLSDLHFGEVVERNGKEIFNLEIAEARFQDIVLQALGSPEFTAYDVDSFVVLLAGDIIDGELIFPAQAYESEGAVFEQLQKATKIIWKALTTIAEFYPVEVYCVPGNHGRSSKLHNQMSNWDNALYFSLRMMASLADKEIEVHLPHQMWMDFPVRQWTVHTRHIGVTQATTPSPAKKVMSWMDGHNADLFFYGHYHNPEMYSYGYKRIFKNGALPPANEFAERLGYQDSVGQWLVAVSDTNPVEFSKIIIPFV